METKTFTYLHPAEPEQEGLDLMPNAINVYASMPCPLKVPFKQIFSSFVDDYNASHPQKPVFCPDIFDCGSQDLELLMDKAKCENCLPDIIVANNYEIIFHGDFSERFLKTGIFEGVTKASDLEAMPANIRENLIQNNVGVLCFGSKSVVQDLTVEGIPAPITSWKELLTPEMEGQFTVHGHLDKATFGVTYFLHEHFGEEGIIRYAQNIADIKHFSQIIKRLNSDDKHKTAFSFLPDVAVSKIPSNKKIKILELEEGKILSPMIMLVKKSKREQCSAIIDAFHSKNFRAMLSDGCILPCDLNKDKAYSMPDLGLSPADFKQLNSRFNSLYLQNLNYREINERAVPGGVCN